MTGPLLQRGAQQELAVGHGALAVVLLLRPAQGAVPEPAPGARGGVPGRARPQGGNSIENNSD